MISDKKGIQYLAAIMKAKGIKDLVISPGSRNAPVINTFASQDWINTYSIVDERSAAFFALGLALKTDRIVALSCTSGTAALNYAPAVTEAFYQKIPLLILTADRPVEMIDQADGQTIRQKDLYGKHIRKSIELSQSLHNEEDIWYNNRLINEALNASLYPVKGPVHINLPFREPLYDLVDAKLPDAKIIDQIIPDDQLTGSQQEQISSMINQSEKVMILGGQSMKDHHLDQFLGKISRLKQVIVLSETNTNLENSHGVCCIDRTLAAIPEENHASFAPDILITFGDAIVSKKIKAFLRNNPPAEHLHISPDLYHPDTYQCLSRSIFIKPANFFEQILPEVKNGKSDYHRAWTEKRDEAHRKHLAFLDSCNFSDLKAFEAIFNTMPTDADLHLGNSSPVRYGQLFRHHPETLHLSNRGTSGIDGSLSTAVGYAFASERLSTVVLGELAFMYDSNALWNNYVPENLRIIVINNGGGNIFRIIAGPACTDHLEKFYETKHEKSVEGIVKAFGLHYDSVKSDDELEQALENFFSRDFSGAAVLEIFTDRKKSPAELKKYFAFLSGKTMKF